MAIFKVPRITSLQRTNLVLEAAEIVFDTDLKIYFGGDGATQGGVPLAKGGGSIVELFTLTQTDIDNKQIILNQSPLDAMAVKLLPQGGIEQINGVDFIVENNVLRWNGFGLDNFLEAGDIITVTY